MTQSSELYLLELKLCLQTWEQMVLSLWIVPVGIETSCQSLSTQLLSCSELYLLELKLFISASRLEVASALNCTCWNWNRYVEIVGNLHFTLWIVPVGIETRIEWHHQPHRLHSELYLLELKLLTLQVFSFLYFSELYLLELKRNFDRSRFFFFSLWIVPVGIETLLNPIWWLYWIISELYLLELKPCSTSLLQFFTLLWIVPVGIET